MTDLLGGLLTLLAVGAFGFGGLAGAWLLLAPRDREDPLVLLLGAGVVGSGFAVGWPLLLGMAGVLWFPVALSAQLLVSLALLWRVEAVPGRPWRADLARISARVGEGLRRHGAPALLVGSAALAELLRGVLRPPLSWDSLMYHLLPAALWVQSGELTPFFGPYPQVYYAQNAMNGSLWLWWWLAGSHSELYVNLAYAGHWLLLAAGTGALARELGARRNWPLAAFVVAGLPTVVRFVATQYADLFMASLLACAAVFGARHARTGDTGSAAVMGAALGLAGGAKQLGEPYALALGGLFLVLTAARRRVRAVPVAVALLAFFAFGAYFYVRNALDGLGFVAGGGASAWFPAPVVCEAPNPLGLPPVADLTLAARAGEILREGGLAYALLGAPWPTSSEMGVGPVALCLGAALALLWRARSLADRGLAVVILLHAAVQAVIFVTVPIAVGAYLLANVRYLDLAFGYGAAALAVLLEGSARSRRGARLLTVLVGAQSLLQSAAAMPLSVRVGLGTLDALVLAWALAPDGVRRWGRSLGAPAMGLLLLAAVPTWARFRLEDRGRALSEEYAVHASLSTAFGPAWSWLDAHGGEGRVAVSGEPQLEFVYPALGPRLERPVVYVNINAQDARRAVEYPRCDPRVDPDPAAWVRNLAASRARWLLLMAEEPDTFPVEDRWARATSGLTLEFADAHARIYRIGE